MNTTTKTTITTPANFMYSEDVLPPFALQLHNDPRPLYITCPHALAAEVAHAPHTDYPAHAALFPTIKSALAAARKYATETAELDSTLSGITKQQHLAEIMDRCEVVPDPAPDPDRQPGQGFFPPEVDRFFEGCRQWSPNLVTATLTCATTIYATDPLVIQYTDCDGGALFIEQLNKDPNDYTLTTDSSEALHHSTMKEAEQVLSMCQTLDPNAKLNIVPLSTASATLTSGTYTKPDPKPYILKITDKPTNYIQLTRNQFIPGNWSASNAKDATRFPDTETALKIAHQLKNNDRGFPTVTPVRTR